MGKKKKNNNALTAREIKQAKMVIIGISIAAIVIIVGLCTLFTMWS